MPASGLARSCLTSRSWYERHDPSFLQKLSLKCCYHSCATSADIRAYCDAESVQGMSERPHARKSNEPLASKEEALIECSELHSTFYLICVYGAALRLYSRHYICKCLCRGTAGVLQDGFNLWVALQGREQSILGLLYPRQGELLLRRCPHCELQLVP